MKRGLSIRYKFLAVTTLLLVVCVGIDLAMGMHVFRKDKTELVFDFNRSMVTNLASDLDMVFASATDKMRLAAYFFNAKDEKSLAIVNELLSASREIVFVGGADRFESINRTFFSNQAYLETYALPANFFAEGISETRAIPFAKLQSEGEAIWNASVDKGPALIGYGKSVVIDGMDGQPIAHYAVVAYLRADRMAKSLSRGKLGHAYITTTEGEMLVRPDSIGDDRVTPLIDAARSQDVKSSVLPFTDGEKDYLGAFAKAGNNRLLVLSKVSTEAAFAVVGQFLTRSLLVALMVLNLAFIAAIIFSKSLTRPIETLAQGMQKVAEGDLSTSNQIQSRDEIALLATSFNGMIRELKTSREALEEVNKDLESKVIERTSQLEKQNQAVKSAQEALLKTSRLAAVGEIAGRAAHEVLNPLTTIVARLERLQERVGKSRDGDVNILKDMLASWRQEFSVGGFAQLVKSWEAPSKVMQGARLWEEDLRNIEQIRDQFTQELKRVNEDAAFLHREAQRIGRIVQQMRSLSVAKAQRVKQNLLVLLEDAANVMRDLASQHGTTLSIVVGVSRPEVWVDPDEFLQSVTNLLRNSVQAVSERRKKEPSLRGDIQIRLVETPDAWWIKIVDNGIGIPVPDLTHLFEQQFSTKSHGEGTGLGLNISRRFIRAVGGDIFLESSIVDQGTIFCMTLPKHQSEQGAA
jgi:signal transduction histidine kinase